MIGVDLVTALPLALLHLRARASGSTGLSLFEILTARPMPAPTLPITPNLKDVDRTRPSYMRDLMAAFFAVFQHRVSELPQSLQTTHLIEPRTWVLIKDLQRKNWNQWRGPLSSDIISTTAVRNAERDSWVHLSHSRVVKDGEDYLDSTEQYYRHKAQQEDWTVPAEQAGEQVILTIR